MKKQIFSINTNSIVSDAARKETNKHTNPDKTFILDRGKKFAELIVRDLNK